MYICIYTYIYIYVYMYMYIYIYVYMVTVFCRDVCQMVRPTVIVIVLFVCLFFHAGN